MVDVALKDRQAGVAARQDQGDDLVQGGVTLHPHHLQTGDHDLPHEGIPELKDTLDELPFLAGYEAPFLAFNGIQTQSAQTYALAAELADMAALGVGLVRVYPQAEGTAAVLAALAALRDGNLPADAAQAQLEALMPEGPCRGYWYGEAGIAAAPEALS